jgi:hypothetical protein
MHVNKNIFKMLLNKFRSFKPYMTAIYCCFITTRNLHFNERHLRCLNRKERRTVQLCSKDFLNRTYKIKDMMAFDKRLFLPLMAHTYTHAHTLARTHTQISLESMKEGNVKRLPKGNVRIEDKIELRKNAL